MPIFEYIGINSKGKRSAGTVDADNERVARAKLRRMGVFPTSLNPEGAKRARQKFTSFSIGGYFKRVRVQEIALMTRQLAVLLKANIPLVDSLNAVIEQVENLKLKTILVRARDKVVEGSRLSDALRGNPGVFNDIYVNMVNAGEASGALDIVMDRLAEFTEGQARLRNKIRGAMTYPIIMAIVGLTLTAFLFVWLVPRMVVMIKNMKKEIPLPTQVLISISDTVQDYWYIVIAVGVALVWGIKRYLKSPKGRERWDRRLLTLPVFGRLVRMVAIARFARTLGTLLSSGVPLLTAMDIVRNVVTNTRLRAIIEQTRDFVREGQSIAEPLKKSGEFPPMVTHMIAIGEKTGELEKMLERIAETYDNEVDTTVLSLTSVLEPVMILIMAGIVGFVVMSIMLGMLQTSDF